MLSALALSDIINVPTYMEAQHVSEAVWCCSLGYFMDINDTIAKKEKHIFINPF